MKPFASQQVTQAAGQQQGRKQGASPDQDTQQMHSCPEGSGSIEMSSAGQCLTPCMNCWPLGGVLAHVQGNSYKVCAVEQDRPPDLMH